MNIFLILIILSNVVNCKYIKLPSIDERFFGDDIIHKKPTYHIKHIMSMEQLKNQFKQYNLSNINIDKLNKSQLLELLKYYFT